MRTGEDDAAPWSRCAQPVLPSSGCDDDGIVGAGSLHSIHGGCGVVEDLARAEAMTDVLTRRARDCIDICIEEASELNRGCADGSRRTDHENPLPAGDTGRS